MDAKKSTALALLILALALAGALKGSLPTAIGDLTYAYARVEIRNGTFVPANVAVYKNATVVWFNSDPEEHALYIDNRRVSHLFPGESYTLNAHEFGTFRCSCDDRTAGQGMLIVR